ncbi:MAG: hypothetical protein AMXMBFR12_07990 [Candidatus Babeliales bacterium]
MRFLPIFSVFFALLLINRYFIPQNTSKKPLISIHLDTLRSDYAKESERVMTAIRVEFGIPQQIWDQYMADFKQLVAQDTLLNKKPKKVTSKQLIPRLLEEYGINKNKVHIQKLGGNNQAEAFQDVTDDHIIHCLNINFDWLKTRSAGEQEAILRHEIQHLLNYDSIEEMYIRWILTDQGYTEQDWKNSASMTDYYHLRELRADAFACASNKNMAQSLHDYFCDTMCLNESREEWYTHPRDTVRAQQLALLHNLNSNYQILA